MVYKNTILSPLMAKNIAKFRKIHTCIHARSAIYHKTFCNKFSRRFFVHISNGRQLFRTKRMKNLQYTLLPTKTYVISKLKMGQSILRRLNYFQPWLQYQLVYLYSLTHYLVQDFVDYLIFHYLAKCNKVCAG